MLYNDAGDFLCSLKAGQVYSFHGHIHTEHNHYQVILNKNFYETGTIIYCSIATSQIEKKEKFIELKGFSKETLVIVEENQIPFFKKRTCFNCNDVLQYSVYDMFSEYLENQLIYVGVLPSTILEQIYHGIKISSNISEQTKRKIGL